MPAKQKILAKIATILILTNVAWGEDGRGINYSEFYQAFDREQDKQAMLIGQEIFHRIEDKYRADAGFGVLKSKMAAANFLANQMIDQLKKANHSQICVMAEELLETDAKHDASNSISVAPAKNYYDNSKDIFSKPIDINSLDSEEIKFLTLYYDLMLRTFIDSISISGQSLSIAQPDFKDTYDYVLVLPLLHASSTHPVNINVFPAWLRRSSQLRTLSDSCLLHYNFIYHAKVFAELADEQDNIEFSQDNFYKWASNKCVQHGLPHVAVDCLKYAIGLIDKDCIDEQIVLRFDIVQIWLDSGNFSLAASEAQFIADNFPGHNKCGNAIWLHFYGLSKTNNINAILSNIDKAIEDIRCSDYKARLMYIKWWNLRRQKGHNAQIAALEHRLLTDYPNEAMIAPIMLSHATDLLAKQEYAQVRALLKQIQDKFPDTQAANQARKIGDKINTYQGLK